MKIAIKDILSKIINISFRLVFVLLFVSCSFYKPDNAYVRLQAYEDSLYSECLKDSAEFDKCGFYSIFNDNSFVELLKSDTSSLSYPFEYTNGIIPNSLPGGVKLNISVNTGPKVEMFKS